MPLLDTMEIIPKTPAGGNSSLSGNYSTGPVFNMTMIVKAVALQRSRKAGEALVEAANQILSGPRHGISYTRNGVTWQASSAGEPPAQVSGDFRRNWQAANPIIEETYDGVIIHAGIMNSTPYMRFFDPKIPMYEMSRLAERPFVNLIIQQAEPAISRIMDQPWLNG